MGAIFAMLFMLFDDSIESGYDRRRLERELEELKRKV